MEVMELKKDARVITGDGEEIGRVDRVVIDPRTRNVTHLVVRKGMLFKEDRVVPADLITTTREEEIRLRPDERDLPDLPVFEELHYVRADGDANDVSANSRPSPGVRFPQPLYMYPVGSAGLGYFGQTSTLSPYMAATERNIPEGTVPLREGASVFTRDGKRVGEIEEVFTDRASRRIVSFTVSSGLLFKERKPVPAAWIDRVEEDAIRLAVGESTVESLNERMT